MALLLPLVGVLPTFGNGIMNAADAPLHVQRIFAMGTLLAQGELYPRWVSWFHLGYGYPVFNFYPPGVFYVGGLLMLLGFSAVMAFHVVAAAVWMFGSLGMYRLARLALPPYAALVAAAAWAYAPSRLFEVWTQGSLPQMAASMCIVWLLYALCRAASVPTRAKSVWLALSLAGLVFSHQPLTFIAALFVAPLSLGLVLWHSRTDWRTLRARAASVYGGLLLGAGLTAIFLLPVFLEIRHINAATGTDDVVAYLRSNFLQLDEALSYPLPPDMTDIRVEYPRTLGLLHVALFAVGMVGLWRRRMWALSIALLGGLGFTVYMLVEPSLPLWLTIPFFQQLRFPERFLRVGAVWVALGAGAALMLFPVRWQARLAASFCALLILSMLPFAYPTQPFTQYNNMSAITEIEFELDTYTWGTTSYNEFKPRWGASVPYDPPPDIGRYADMPTRIFPLRYFPYEQVNPSTFIITTDAPQALPIRQFYYPGWQVTVNGQRVDAYPEPEQGLLTVDVGTGEQRVEVRYRGTTVQRIGTAITLASAVLLLGLLRVPQASSVPSVTATTGASIGWQTGLITGGALVGFALLNTNVILPYTSLFRVVSAPSAPTYMQHAQPATFEQMQLLGYSLPQTTLGAGDVLTVTLFWQPLVPLTDEHYRPVVQLVNNSVTETWAVSQPFFPSGGHTFSGRYTPDVFTSDGHDLRLFESAKPYTARVMVQLFDARTNTPLTLADGTDRVLLNTPIRVTLPTEPAQNMLNVVFGENIALHCADITRADDEYRITAYWHVLTPPSASLTTFVHGLDAGAALVTQADQPPIPEYPTQDWARGQTLSSTFTLPATDGIESVALGLYTSDGTRLPVTQHGQPQPNQQVMLPLESACPTGS